jgi:5-methylcytosine-specific restriction endonuclease McrA
MRRAVLFLDHDWMPLRIEPWQRAISDFFLGKIEVIEYSRDRTIQGVGRTHPMPSVVRVLRRFRRDRLRIKFSRVNIFARDAFTCQFCGRRCPTEELTFDHVLPRSRGGRTTWENIVTCCVPCNKEKADRTPAEAGMRLRAAPRKPRFLPSVTVRGMGGGDIPEAWRPYWSSALDP